ncbi:monoamine oxidase [Nonlabens sp. Hel1_33_55]|uniref:flavin monoamine oxidase family protein n=1 Tax=Nonlabens sp. Hel1_33_55 TaxID=1336802 RepID=UPI000875B75D|nr:NAD(P)/FAD-dependent oxidoreductase [Nonlabens sp. Hel1_33_55]SCY09278.1 monoamine oxidase [Nonlabens sp. Hel1_33_55]
MKCGRKTPNFPRDKKTQNVSLKPLEHSKGFFMHSTITIIGGGLTGLTLAYQLKKARIDFLLLEARPRLGGRIFTKMSGNHIPIDLGAAWFWDYNPRVKKLLEELQIPAFPQKFGTDVWYQGRPNADFQQIQIPEQQQTSYRIKGGTTNLILSLAAKLDHNQVHLETQVLKISYRYSKYTIQTNNGFFDTDLVINTLPPALNSQLEYDPELPQDYIDIAVNTHTWMQDSIKFGLGFKTAFWEQLNLPVTAFSNFAIASEIYDYSNINGDRFAIMGFLNSHFSQLDKVTRKQKVLEQLSSFLGKNVLDHVSYEECAWIDEPFTKTTSQNQLQPHQNNGDSKLRSSFNNDTLIMAGSETSSVLSGYMEGAVNSAMETFDRIQK